MLVCLKLRNTGRPLIFSIIIYFIKSNIWHFEIGSNCRIIVIVLVHVSTILIHSCYRRSDPHWFMEYFIGLQRKTFIFECVIFADVKNALDVVISLFHYSCALHLKLWIVLIVVVTVCLQITITCTMLQKSLWRFIIL